MIINGKENLLLINFYMKTIEKLEEEYGKYIPHFTKKNIVILENNIIIKIGVISDIISFLTKIEKINFTDYEYHVIAWIKRSLKSKNLLSHQNSYKNFK